MKKIFTLISAVMLSFSAMAEDYHCGLAVNVYGEPSPYKTIDISCTKNDNGKYDITLKDFTFGELSIAEVNFKDIDVVDDGDTTEEDGLVRLYSKQNISISEFDDLPISATLEGFIINGDILIRVYLPDVGVTAAVTSRKTQIYGSDFENWHKTKTGSYDEPNGWHGIKSGTGTFASFAKNAITISEDVPSETQSTKSVCIKSSVAIGISANGTLTTGRMKVGNTDPNSSDNCVIIDPTSTDKDGNGDPFFSSMVGYPTSISFWYKFKNGENNTKPALARAIILSDGYYQEPAPEGTTYDNVVAVAEKELAATEGWTKVTIPFDYATYAGNENADNPLRILVTVNTCKEPGGGSKSSDNPDVLFIDEMNLDYKPELSSLYIFEQKIDGFSEDQDTYSLTLSDVPEDDDIEFESKNYEETAVISYYEEDKKTLTVNVYNEEFTSWKSYTFNLTIDPTAGVNNIQVNANRKVEKQVNAIGQQVGNSSRGFVIKKYNDGSVEKIIK